MEKGKEKIRVIKVFEQLQFGQVISLEEEGGLGER